MPKGEGKAHTYKNRKKELIWKEQYDFRVKNIKKKKKG